MKKVQEMRANGIVVCLDIDHAAVMAVVIPVEQGRAQVCHQAIRDIACIGKVVVVFLRQDAAKGGCRGAHHIHRVARGRQRLEYRLQLCRQTAQ